MSSLHRNDMSLRNHVRPRRPAAGSLRTRTPAGALTAIWCALSALALSALALTGASAAILKPLNPCALVTNDDVLHQLGWTVQSRERKPYDLHGGVGSMCFIASEQGQVVVILPDPGSDFPGISVYNDPNAAGLAKKVTGLGAEVTLYNGTVYVVRKHREVAVRVVPDNHMASYDEIEGFARVIIHRLH